jgi:prolyl-tRNA synthetase
MEKEVKPPRLLPKKEELTDWFNSLLLQAQIIDYSYPLKGCGVWLSYGWKLRNQVIEIMRNLLAETGHEETYFPFLIPEDVFGKEAEFIKGFEDEVYWVTHGGKKELDVKLAIRPTSETPMYYMFSKWVKSASDLPLKVWQVVSVFRYETKATRPLIRVREITTFKEAHTAHATAEEAEAQIKEAVEIYKRFFDELCIPYVITRRPDYDKFPGAVYTLAFDTIFPDGRTLQIGTVHYLGENFARAFEIQYTDKEGKKRYVHQTCYGISERVIASVIAIHGDDHGLILPPKIAPIQVVVIPIHAKGVDVDGYAKNVFEELKKHFRTVIDLRDKRPGEKFYDWEIKGVPIRVEVGPTEVRNKTVTIVRRDNFQRKAIALEKIVEEISATFEEITENIKRKAWDAFNKKIIKVGKFIDLEGEDVVSALLDEEGNFTGGIVEIPVCGNEECELKIRKYVNVLGTPLTSSEPSSREACCVCGRPAKKYILLSRTY